MVENEIANKTVNRIANATKNLIVNRMPNRMPGNTFEKTSPLNTVTSDKRPYNIMSITFYFV